MKKTRYLSMLAGVILLLAACRREPQSCPAVDPAPWGTLNGRVAAGDPIQFPVDDYRVAGPFTAFDSDGFFKNKYHAAEDIKKPAGSPVSAIADGNISYSGEKDGYGWLIIVDHPQANTYSLYGHLSPSRWARDRGAVDKGELIGYIGDGDENGYNDEVGWIAPHLHFAIRLGQRSSYTGNGDGRWMAGWTYNCPEELGWLQPSWFITAYAEEGPAIVADNLHKPTFFDRVPVAAIAYGVIFCVVNYRILAAIRRRRRAKQVAS